MVSAAYLRGGAGRDEPDRAGMASLPANERRSSSASFRCSRVSGGRVARGDGRSVTLKLGSRCSPSFPGLSYADLLIHTRMFRAGWFRVSEHPAVRIIAISRNRCRS